MNVTAIGQVSMCQEAGGKSYYNEEQVLSSKSCQVVTRQLLNDTDRCMSSVNMTSMYITISNENTDINT